MENCTTLVHPVYQTFELALMQLETQPESPLLQPDTITQAYDYHFFQLICDSTAIHTDGYDAVFPISHIGNVCEWVCLISPIDIKSSIHVRIRVANQIAQLPPITGMKAFHKHYIKIPRIARVITPHTPVFIEFQTKIKIGCQCLYPRQDISKQSLTRESMMVATFSYTRGSPLGLVRVT
jgi:hypothetical protein